jgi:hypothetical protein
MWSVREQHLSGSAARCSTVLTEGGERLSCRRLAIVDKQHGEHDIKKTVAIGAPEHRSTLL